MVSTIKFAIKCEEAGVDAIVAEGFEAGGHNGREESTTMVLIPQIRKSVSLPLDCCGWNWIWKPDGGCFCFGCGSGSSRKSFCDDL